MPNTAVLIFIISSLPIAVLAVVFLFQKLKQKKPDYTGQPLNFNQAQEESLKTLHEAIKKSQEILSKSEVEQIKAVTESRMETELFESELKEQFKKQTEESLQKIELMNKDYQKFLESLKQQAATAQENNQALILNRINTLFENFEQNLSNFLTQTQQQSLSSIDLELKAARSMIETYKQQQFHLIDENIVAILERTLALILTRKLTLKDQVDLIYESLEQAKTEKFIA